MKKIILCAAIILSAAAFKDTAAQVRVHVNFNIGSQPVWGPTGYDYVEYYYLPDIDAYYYVPRHHFVYLSGNRWIFSAYLPTRYRDYDIYRGYKVVVNEPRAYLHYDQHRAMYSRYREHWDRQPIIRNRDDERYKHHEDHGNHRGWGRH